MLTAWRIVRAEYADEAFSGEGAMRFPGRWNSAGTRMVYTAESVALATLEILVHMQRPSVMPAYLMVPCYFHEVLVEELDRAKLPPDWFADQAPPELRQIGDAWARDRVSPVLKVPSAVVPIESNYLLNPEHPDFASVDIGEARPFVLDLRLVT